jgi:hypothetical protein
LGPLRYVDELKSGKREDPAHVLPFFKMARSGKTLGVDAVEKDDVTRKQVYTPRPHD